MGASMLDKTSPFSTPTKPSPKLTSSVEAKENRLTSPIFTNHIRSSTKKNFMSPTISASSKTVAQRKKVLAERNGGEATDPTCAKFHRRTSFDLKQGTLDMGASTESLTSSINEISRIEDGVDDAKLEPYDPVLNYCSPRPKFLLYKPDRRSEILRRYEVINSTSSESESSVEHEECLVEQNGEVTVEVRDVVNHKDEVVVHLDESTEGSVEGINEKVEKTVEEVGKKSEDHNETLENIEHCNEFRGNIETATRSTTLENETSEIKIEALQNKDVDEISIQHMEFEDEGEEGEFEEEGELERFWSFKSLLKIWLVIVILGLSILYLSSMNSISVGLNGDDWKVHSDLHRAPFIHDNASGYAIHDELAKMGFEEASHRIKGEIIIKEPDHYSGEPLEDANDVENEGSHVKVFSDVVDVGLVGVFETDEVEAAEDEIYSPSTENVAGGGNADDIVGEELVHLEENAKPEVVIQTEEIETENHDALTEVVQQHSEPSKADYREMDVSGDVNHHIDVTLDETVAFDDSTEDELEKVEEVTEVVSTLAMVDDGLSMGYSKETTKTAIVGVVSSLLLAFIIGFLGFPKPKRNNKTTKLGADSFNSGVGAPRVQLLAEYTIGEKEDILRTDYAENYNDSSSLSHRNLKMSTSQPPYGGETSQRRSHKKEVPTSSIDSPSYGSFTTEMMFLNKEEAGGGEKIIVTPVRRSSRIHSKRTPGASQRF